MSVLSLPAPFNRTLGNPTSSVSAQPTVPTVGFAVDEAPPSMTVAVGPLIVQLALEGDQWVALEHRTGMFGEGDTWEQALRDLFVSLAELQIDLEANDGRLAPHLQAQLGFLHSLSDADFQGA